MTNQQENSAQAFKSFWDAEADIAHYPTRLELVSSGACNLACAMCYTHGDPRGVFDDKK